MSEAAGETLRERYERAGAGGELADLWRRLRRNRAAMAGAGVVAVFVLLALLAPALVPFSPIQGDLGDRLQAPSPTHWRIIFGARISLQIQVVAVLLAFPSIFLALGIIAALGAGLVNLMIAAGISSIPAFARIVRGSVLSLKEREFVEAARALGAGGGRILCRHLLPNCLAPIIVQATLRMATVLLTASGLSFLGLGVQPPTPEWGAMLSNARSYLIVAPYVATIPGLAIMVVVVGFNLFGDGLRDTLDPRLR